MISCPTQHFYTFIYGEMLIHSSEHCTRDVAIIEKLNQAQNWIEWVSVEEMKMFPNIFWQKPLTIVIFVVHN